MTPSIPAPIPAPRASGSLRTITEVGPYTGATSYAVGTGLVFFSGDGTWGRHQG